MYTHTHTGRTLQPRPCVWTGLQKQGGSPVGGPLATPKGIRGSQVGSPLANGGQGAGLSCILQCGGAAEPAHTHEVNACPVLVCGRGGKNKRDSPRGSPLARFRPGVPPPRGRLPRCRLLVARVLILVCVCACPVLVYGRGSKKMGLPNWEPPCKWSWYSRVMPKFSVSTGAASFFEAFSKKWGSPIGSPLASGVGIPV